MRTTRCRSEKALLPALLLIVNTASALAGDAIPITSSSEEARKSYLEGRRLFEELRFAEARPHYQAAATEDPDFAMAYWGLANTANTANDFWRALEKAVALAPQASDGERLQILMLEAGARSQPEKQLELCRRLIERYPGDERAQNAVGNFYFARQEYTTAIGHYEKAIEINPDFAPTYNQLGYAYRFTGDYTGAEEAFKKYIELIPNAPNPYDSYAELLMKMGRFEESITNYERALEQNPRFVPSFIGIAQNYVFMDAFEKARGALDELLAGARNDGERRQALFWTAQSYVHQNKYDRALEVMEERYRIAAEDDDLPTMTGDLNQIGTLLLEAGQPDRALERFDRAVGIIERAHVPDDAKAAARRAQLFNTARVFLARGEAGTAGSLAQQYRERVEKRQVPFELWQAHELAGMVALAAEDYATAIAELEQANQQSPRVLYLTALAFAGRGDAGSARAACEQSANFNGLDANYAYIRGKAREMLAASASSM